jgi:hypothetical protein
VPTHRVADRPSVLVEILDLRGQLIASECAVDLPETPSGEELDDVQLCLVRRNRGGVCAHTAIKLPCDLVVNSTWCRALRTATML